jgi:hypothetical protein
VKVVAFNLEREELVLIDAAVLNLIHSIKLSLEKNKLAGSGRILVKKTLLELLEGVNDL